jgi:putative lipoprotein
MKNKYSFKEAFLLLLVGSCMIGCNEENDVNPLDNRSDLVIEASATDIKLNEDTPNDIALTLNWTKANPISSEYSLSYIYKVDLASNDFDENTLIKEFVDGESSKSYTHKELQQLLTDKWELTPGTTTTLSARIIGSLEGPKFVKPEISTVSVKIQTYIEKEFKADKLYISGTAVDGEDIEIRPMVSNPLRYVGIVSLKAGNINFPIVYEDENKVNVISPVVAEQTIQGGKELEAVVKSAEKAGVWVIPESDTYRVLVDFEHHTVSIGFASDYIAADKIFVSGTCVSEKQEMTQTIENENQYAFHAELQSGNVYFPILFDGEESMAIAPETGGDFTDGQEMSFTIKTPEEAALHSSWNIINQGVYRVVINIETKKITIYSPDTDPKPKEIPWNRNGVDYKTVVERVYIWGPYDGWKTENPKPSTPWDIGFNLAHSMTPSLANPYLFIYKGEKLPRQNSIKDKDGNSHPGGLNFKIGVESAGCYAFGSTADAIRGQYDGCIDLTDADLGKKQPLVEGQNNSRYAFFSIPTSVNYVELDIENLTVIFDAK